MKPAAVGGKPKTSLGSSKSPTSNCCLRTDHSSEPGTWASAVYALRTHLGPEVALE